MFFASDKDDGDKAEGGADIGDEIRNSGRRSISRAVVCNGDDRVFSCILPDGLQAAQRKGFAVVRGDSDRDHNTPPAKPTVPPRSINFGPSLEACSSAVRNETLPSEPRTI